MKRYVIKMRNGNYHNPTVSLNGVKDIRDAQVHDERFLMSFKEQDEIAVEVEIKEKGK